MEKTEKRLTKRKFPKLAFFIRKLISVTKSCKHFETWEFSLEFVVIKHLCWRLKYVKFLAKPLAYNGCWKLPICLHHFCTVFRGSTKLETINFSSEKSSTLSRAQSSPWSCFCFNYLNNLHLQDSIADHLDGHKLYKNCKNVAETQPSPVQSSQQTVWTWPVSGLTDQTLPQLCSERTTSQSEDWRSRSPHWRTIRMLVLGKVQFYIQESPLGRSKVGILFFSIV